MANERTFPQTTDELDAYIAELIDELSPQDIAASVRTVLQEMAAPMEDNGSDGEVPLIADSDLNENSTTMPLAEVDNSGIPVRFIQARIRALAIAAASHITPEDMATPVVPQNSNNVTIDPNVLNTWDTDTEGMTSLTVAFNAGVSGKVNEYMLRVRVVTTPFTLKLPAGVTWAGGEAPTFESGTTYEISIINNLAVYAAF